MTDNETITTQNPKFVLLSRTVLMAIFGGAIARLAEFLGIDQDQLIDLMMWGFPALMIFARQITEGGLRWIPWPIRRHFTAIYQRWYPDQDPVLPNPSTHEAENDIDS